MQLRPLYLLEQNELVGLTYVQNVGLLINRVLDPRLGQT